ncbi:MAG: hypothetical protein ACTSX1_05935, partial [Candidatus Heimdallarchaeaceae archaeon]
MDDYHTKTNLFEFLKLLQRGEFKEVKVVLEIIQNLTRIIEKTLNPSFVLINFYDQETQLLIPFSVSSADVKK